MRVTYQVRTAATNRPVFVADDLTIAEREVQRRRERVGIDFKLFRMVETEEEVLYNSVR